MIKPQQQSCCSTSSKDAHPLQQINNIPVINPSSSKPTKTHHSADDHHQAWVDELLVLQADHHHQPYSSTHHHPAAVELIMTKDVPVNIMYSDSSTSVPPPPPPAEVSGREKLKRHRVEVAGRVWIPDLWGQEEFLKDWIDCSAFDSSLFPNGITLARAALVEEGRRANSGGFIRIENRSFYDVEEEDGINRGRKIWSLISFAVTWGLRLERNRIAFQGEGMCS